MILWYVPSYDALIVTGFGSKLASQLRTKLATVVSQSGAVMPAGTAACVLSKRAIGKRLGGLLIEGERGDG